MNTNASKISKLGAALLAMSPTVQAASPSETPVATVQQSVGTDIRQSIDFLNSEDTSENIQYTLIAETVEDSEAEPSSEKVLMLPKGAIGVYVGTTIILANSASEVPSDFGTITPVGSTGIYLFTPSASALNSTYGEVYSVHEVANSTVHVTDDSGNKVTLQYPEHALQPGIGVIAELDGKQNFYAFTPNCVVDTTVTNESVATLPPPNTTSKAEQIDDSEHWLEQKIYLDGKNNVIEFVDVQYGSAPLRVILDGNKPIKYPDFAYMNWVNEPGGRAYVQLHVSKAGATIRQSYLPMLADAIKAAKQEEAKRQGNTARVNYNAVPSQPSRYIGFDTDIRNRLTGPKGKDIQEYLNFLYYCPEYDNGGLERRRFTTLPAARGLKTTKGTTEQYINELHHYALSGLYRIMERRFTKGKIKQLSTNNVISSVNVLYSLKKKAYENGHRILRQMQYSRGSLSQNRLAQEYVGYDSLDDMVKLLERKYAKTDAVVRAYGGRLPNHPFFSGMSYPTASSAKLQESSEIDLIISHYKKSVLYSSKELEAEQKKVAAESLRAYEQEQKRAKAEQQRSERRGVLEESSTSSSFNDSNNTLGDLFSDPPANKAESNSDTNSTLDNLFSDSETNPFTDRFTENYSTDRDSINGTKKEYPDPETLRQKRAMDDFLESRKEQENPSDNLQQAPDTNSDNELLDKDAVVDELLREIF